MSARRCARFVLPALLAPTFGLLTAAPTFADGTSPTDPQPTSGTPMYPACVWVQASGLVPFDTGQFCVGEFDASLCQHPTVISPETVSVLVCIPE
jgi:hypothetical protein